MRDVIKIIAAGSILTAYALLTPTLVEAVPATAPAKTYSHRLVMAETDAPVSKVTEYRGSRTVLAPRSALPNFAVYGDVR